MNGMPSNFFFDYTNSFAQFSGDEREISLFYCARGELFGQSTMRAVILRDDEAAARLLIESVNDPGPFFSSDAG